MAPRKYKCAVADCDWEEQFEPDEGPIWLKYHIDSCHPVVQRAKPPPLPLPKLSSQIFEEFCREWDNWKSSSNVEAGKETSYLINCCERGAGVRLQHHGQA